MSKFPETDQEAHGFLMRYNLTLKIIVDNRVALQRPNGEELIFTVREKRTDWRSLAYPALVTLAKVVQHNDEFGAKARAFLDYDELEALESFLKP